MHTLFRFLLTACLLLGSALHGQTSAPSSDVYRLNQQDLLTITVYDNPDLTTSQRVDVQGRVQIPLLGRVEIGGLTVGDAENKIEQLFRDERYLRNPQVTVSIDEYTPKQISIFGEVRSPGQVSLPIENNRIPIVEALSRAGGFTGIADTGDVKITRTDEEGRRTTIRVDVQKFLKARNDVSNQDGYFVYAGDIIVVPQRLF
ncbi:MAG: polysaccharide biosynthesis/export family protein [Verrucomicrobiota bacterium JB022]|nr:polysaccharide biosynthesis/export family protein [Verrucomicrobiota bacterium JB022]